MNSSLRLFNVKSFFKPCFPSKRANAYSRSLCWLLYWMCSQTSIKAPERYQITSVCCIYCQPFKRESYKMVKHTQNYSSAICRQIVLVFVHFTLALKGLTLSSTKFSLTFIALTYFNPMLHFNIPQNVRKPSVWVYRNGPWATNRLH